MEYTTVKIYKGDAFILKQLQNFLELQRRDLNQADFLREVLEFLYAHEQDFFREAERTRKRHKELADWMRILSRRMQEI